MFSTDERKEKRFIFKIRTEDPRGKSARVDVVGRTLASTAGVSVINDEGEKTSRGEKREEGKHRQLSGRNFST